MAIQGFDTNHFVEELFKHAQTNYPQWAKGKTVDDLKTELRVWYPEAKSLDDAAEQFYTEFGVKWGLTPNKYFNPAEYRQAWAEKQATTHLTSVADALVAYDAEVSGEDYKGDAYDHYLKEGAAMGVNPSNAFDESSYLEKLITTGDGLDKFTPPTLRAVAIKAGVTPLSFFIDNENPEYDVDPIAVPEGERVDTNIIIPDDTDYDQTFTLTPGIDTWNGGKGKDVVRGVAGQTIGSQDQTTLNSSDVLDGGTDADTLVVLLNGNYGGGATVSNFETIQIGTNNTAPVAFDYNINAGFYEIVNTNIVVADQITTGETLSIVNITPSAVGNIGPALHWENEPVSIAGTVALTYRQATTNGASTNQDVTLENVTATTSATAVLNIGAGVEKVTIESAGAVPQNTLSNSTGTNYTADTGSNNVPADLISSGSLASVVLTGATAIGRAAGVAAPTGLTDRLVAADTGITATPTASDLLSVGSRVTSVDASAMTASANVRFTAKLAGAPTNVSFAGGHANDYVEFELGNVSATGGEGNDTFSFINISTNSSFGESDVLNGNDGTDTIQIGLNGAGTYNISQTELRNKTSIEVLDLRGGITNLTLSSEFVAASDTSDITINTDRIVRTAVGTDLNGTSTSGAEDNSINTVNLTFLNGSQAVNFKGGTGSDRLILNDANFNVLQTLDGGVFDLGYAIRHPGIATARNYDTLTVTTNGENVVLDAQDTSKVSNFNGMILTKNAPAATYVIDLNNALLNANTAAIDDTANTTLDDRVFVIGTVAGANNSALGAGDSVTFNLDGLTGTPTGRSFDLTSLATAGVTMNFVQKGTSYSSLALTTGVSGYFSGVTGATGTTANVATVADPTGNFNTGLGDVLASVAIPAAVIPTPLNILTVNSAGFNTTSGFGINGGTIATAGLDTLNVAANLLAAPIANVIPTINMGGIADGDILNISTPVTGITLAGVNGALAGAIGVENVVLIEGSGANNVIGGLVNDGLGLGQNITANKASTFTLTGKSIGTGSAFADTIFAAAAGSNINGGAGNDTIASSIGNDTMDGGAGNDVILVGGGNDRVTDSAGNDTIFVALGTGEAHTITLNDASEAGSPSDDTIIIANTIFTNAGANTVTINNFNTASDVLSISSANGAGVTGLALSNGVFYDNSTAFTNDHNAFGQGAVIEINANSFQYTNSSNTAAILSHMTGIMNIRSEGTAGNDNITVIAYDAAGNAAIYVADDTTTDAENVYDSLELIGIVSGVGTTNFFTGSHFI